MEFLHWLCLYYDITTELFGEDKQEALKVIDDDARFDQWLKSYNDKNNKPTKKKTSGVAVDKETFLKRTQGILPDPGRKKNAKVQSV